MLVCPPRDDTMWTLQWAVDWKSPVSEIIAVSMGSNN